VKTPTSALRRKSGLHNTEASVSKARQYRRKAEQVAEKSQSPRAKNPLQASVPHLVDQFDRVVIIGGAGTGKTWSAMSAVWQRIAAGKCDRVIISRPTVAADDEELGFLPGTADEKMAPWLMPYQDVLINIVGDRKTAESVMKTFEVMPLAVVRGRNFLDGTCAVIDEIQNMSVSLLTAVLTRGCTGSKTILCGDPFQCDRPGGGGHIIDMADELKAEGAAGVVEFTDDLIIRSPDIIRVNRAMAKVKMKWG
jgi:phosphate starvation-inducible PhoH-like protein